MTESEKVDEKSRFAQTHYIFPCVVYIQEKINAGELTVQEIAETVTQNAEAHGHDNYKFPEDWLDQLPHLANRYGWRIFELPRVLKEQKELAAQRRLQKKQEKQEKQQQERLAKAVKVQEKVPQTSTEAPGNSSEAPSKKKIIVVKRSVQK